jgi:hypothetical protein
MASLSMFPRVLLWLAMWPGLLGQERHKHIAIRHTNRLFDVDDGLEVPGHTSLSFLCWSTTMAPMFTGSFSIGFFPFHAAAVALHRSSSLLGPTTILKMCSTGAWHDVRATWVT